MNSPATPLALASILLQAIDSTCYNTNDGYCANDAAYPACYAGTSDTPCTCHGQKEAYTTGLTTIDNGITYHQYQCCDVGTTSGTTDGTCLEYTTDGDGCTQTKCISVAVSGSGSDCWVKDGDSSRCRGGWEVKFTDREEIMGDGMTYRQFTCCPVEDVGWIAVVIVLVIVFVCCCGPCICYCQYRKRKQKEKANAQAHEQARQQQQMQPVQPAIQMAPPQSVQIVVPQQQQIPGMRQPVPVQQQRQVYQQGQQRPQPTYVNQQQFQQPPQVQYVQQQYQVTQPSAPRMSEPPAYNPRIQQQAQPGAAEGAPPGVTGAAPVQYVYPGKQM